MTTAPDFNEFLATFRSRALKRMENYEKAVEKAHAAALRSIEHSSPKHTPPAPRRTPINPTTPQGTLVRKSW